MKQKRLLTIQDYSCLGRCSLTVALPVVSACGIECVGIPTAVLSNHTAGFTSWTYADLTDKMMPTVDHWMDYRHDFDAIYTGYLATNQVPIVLDIVTRLKREGTLFLVDPAFADSGKIYPGFGREHVAAMRRLVSSSDITVPNRTEACFLCGRPYKEECTPEEAKELLLSLTDLGPRMAVLSGLTFEKGTVGCLYYDKAEKAFGSYFTPSYTGTYHGTGDLFASALVSSLLKGFTLGEAVKIAHDLVHLSIQKTLEDMEPNLCYGVEFEKAIPAFTDWIRAKEKASLR